MLLDYVTTEQRPAARGMLLNYRAPRGSVTVALPQGTAYIGVPEVQAVVFPTQFFGFRAYFQGVAKDLCLVATADAPSGMGGQVRFQKGGVTYAVYLVETNDANASPVRIQTTTGTKAIRLKT